MTTQTQSTPISRAVQVTADRQAAQERKAQLAAELAAMEAEEARPLARAAAILDAADAADESATPITEDGLVRVNWDTVPAEDAPKPDFPLIPLGTYAATIFSATVGTSQSSGNPMITVVARLTDPPYTGRRLNDYYPLTQDMLPKLRRLLTSLGQPADAFKGEQFIDPDVLVDQEVWVEIQHDLYKGTKREKVKTLRGQRAGQPPAHVGPKPGSVLSDDEIPF